MKIKNNKTDVISEVTQSDYKKLQHLDLAKHYTIIDHTNSIIIEHIDSVIIKPEQIVKKEINTILIGTGGCGMEFIQYNWKFDFNTHNRNFLIDKDINFVYIFAHPFNVLLSYEKRGFIPWDGYAAQQIQGDRENLRSKDVKGLNDYLDIGIDCFQFGNHFNCYYGQEANGVFLKYEAFHLHLESLMEQLKLEKKHNRPFIKRTSNYKNIDKTLLDKLEKVHGSYAKHFDSLPDIFTNEVKKEEYFYKNRFDT